MGNNHRLNYTKSAKRLLGIPSLLPHLQDFSVEEVVVILKKGVPLKPNKRCPTCGHKVITKQNDDMIQVENAKLFMVLYNFTDTHLEVTCPYCLQHVFISIENPKLDQYAKK